MTEMIFLSYRRSDSRGYTNAIYTLLELHFGSKQIFMDVDTLIPGVDFVQALEEAVEACDIFLAVIGPRWENIKDAKGLNRLANPEDFVRIEVAHALRRGIPVIPILVDGAQVPSSENLPDNLKPLARRHTFVIGDHLRTDVQRLINVIEKTFNRLEAERIEQEKAEAERQEREKAEAKRQAREKEQAERQAQEKAEAKRQAQEKAEAKRQAREKEQAERQAQEKAEEALDVPRQPIPVNIQQEKTLPAQSPSTVKLISQLKKIPAWGWGIGGLALFLIVFVVTGGFSPNQTEVPSSTEVVQTADVLTIIKATETETTTPVIEATLIETSTPTASQTPDSVVRMISEIDGMEMIYIAAGEFQMGGQSDNVFESNEPVHSVYLDDFYLDQHEVTNAQFSVFLNQQGNQEEGGTRWVNDDRWLMLIIPVMIDGQWESKDGYEEHPVVEVTWYGAQAYCDWAGRRLPTEAEWEKGARGELEGKKYPWGDEDPTCTAGAENGSQFIDCGSYKPKHVKTFSPNGYGLYDMSGNVWEWVADWYEEDYYSKSPAENPQGPFQGVTKSMRGGSYLSRSYRVPLSLRFKMKPRYKGGVAGFRCATSEANFLYESTPSSSLSETAVIGTPTEAESQ
jgi:formylglycine-generating enzyme required for sulfatase activity